jgi:two-component system sensor histidine kinase/response regulator
MRVQELVSDTLVRDTATSICSNPATTVSQRYDVSATRSRNRLLIGVCNAAWMTLLLVGFIYFIVHGGYLKTVAVGSAAIIVGVAASPLRCRWKRAIASTHLSKTREIELVAARDAAEAALRTKSAFLSQMSHEIRTPMNAILGMADLLNDTVLSAEQHKYLSIMINNGGALLDLVDDILDFDRVETGNLTLEAASFDLPELVERVAETLAIRAHQKGLEFALRINSGVPATVVGDALRLRQVLVNLIGNAVKFTERGEIVLTVERDGSAEPGELRFAVSDTGIGVASDQHEKIFARYAQADPAIARTYGGSGLGLAIVKQLVGLMGGRVWVESELGRGSRFSFSARFKISARDEATAPTPNLADARMLIVGATISSGVALAEMLTASGAHITQAENGEAALEELRRAVQEGTPYQFVWFDCRATATDLALLRRICAASHGAGKVIPMLTSNDLNVRLPLLRRLGLVTHVIKPVRRVELFDAIRTLIGAGVEVSAPDLMADHRTFADAPATNPAVLTETLAANADGVSIKSIEPAEHIGDVRHPAPPLNIGRPLRILVADDSADNRLLLEAFLKKTASRVDQAENGEIALEKFIAGKYDVVLMDIQMPVMDGYTAAKLIREWERKNDAVPTPIIALTASVLDEAVHKSFDAGCDTHVSKPVRRPALLAAIREVTAILRPDETSSIRSRLEARANS